jgi:hypothetical protein
MELTNLLRTEAGGVVRLSCEVALGTGHTKTLWIDWPSEAREQIATAIDPFVVMLLPLAGRIRQPIVSAYPVAEILHHNLHEAMAVYESYFPALFTPFDIRVPMERRPRGWGQSASFYSGGVDSLFTIAELEDRVASGTGTAIDQLWIIHGFDIRLADRELWDLVWNRLSTAGPVRQKQCFWIRTNILEDFYGHDVPWPLVGFGPALGGLAKSAADRVSRVYIGSWTKYGNVVPHASTPLVDPLWSCDRQDIVHFSARFDRDAKLRRLVQHPDLLKVLRVCYLNPKGAYNCGRCEKCLRTQVQLEVLGAANVASSFEWPLPPSAVASIRLPLAHNSRTAWVFWNRLKQQCDADPRLHKYSRAIRHAMRMSYFQPLRSLARPLKPLLQRLGFFGERP